MFEREKLESLCSKVMKSYWDELGQIAVGEVGEIKIASSKARTSLITSYILQPILIKIDDNWTQEDIRMAVQVCIKYGIDGLVIGSTTVLFYIYIYI